MSAADWLTWYLTVMPLAIVLDAFLVCVLVFGLRWRNRRST